MGTDWTPWAEAIYSMYPRKVGKRAALKAIHAALTRIEARLSKTNAVFPDLSAVELLTQRVLLYAETVGKWPAEDRVFIPYPASWFNQDRFDDDPAEWRQRRVDRPPGHNDRGDRAAQAL